MWPLLLACSSPSPDSGADGGAPIDEPTQTTLLVYMAADNDLEGFVMHDLHELDAGGSGQGVRVLVQADRAEGHDARGGDWTGTRRYEVYGDDDERVLNARLVEELGETDMGDPATLAGFLAWAAERAPAERTLLVLWSHGDGWSLQPAPPSIAQDDESGSTLSLAGGELQAGLQAYVAAHGPLEMIGFDACYMGAFEVAHALSPYARRMLAAEPWVGNEGILYGPLLQALRARPGEDLAVLLGEAAALSVAEGGERSFGVVDLEAAGALGEALDALAGEALDSEAGLVALAQARREARTAEPWYPKFYLDLGSLAEEAERAGLVAAPALRARLDEAVLRVEGDEDWSWLSGLSIMADLRDEEMLQLYVEGAGASWAQQTRWDEALLALDR